MKSVLTSVDIKKNKMNKGRLRYGAKKTYLQMAGMNIYSFIHGFLWTFCYYYLWTISLHKEQLFEIRQEYFKAIYSFPKGGEGLPCNSAIHSKIFSTSAMCKIALCRERIPSKSYSRNFSEKHTNHSSMVLNMWIKMILLSVYVDSWKSIPINMYQVTETY